MNDTVDVHAVEFEVRVLERLVDEAQARGDVDGELVLLRLVEDAIRRRQTAQRRALCVEGPEL